MVRETLEGSELKAYVDGSKVIPDPEEERDRLAKEHAAQRKAEEEKREAREEEEEREAAVGAVPNTTEDVPAPPHLREPTEELRP
jgi:hypothetical protein